MLAAQMGQLWLSPAVVGKKTLSHARRGTRIRRAGGQSKCAETWSLYERGGRA